MWFICIMMCSVFFFKQKTAYEMRISDWSSDVCSSDLADQHHQRIGRSLAEHGPGGRSPQRASLAIARLALQRAQLACRDFVDRLGERQRGNVWRARHRFAVERESDAGAGVVKGLRRREAGPDVPSW